MKKIYLDERLQDFYLWHKEKTTLCCLFIICSSLSSPSVLWQKSKKNSLCVSEDTYVSSSYFPFLSSNNFFRSDEE